MFRLRSRSVRLRPRCVGVAGGLEAALTAAAIEVALAHHTRTSSYAADDLASLSAPGGKRRASRGAEEPPALIIIRAAAAHPSRLEQLRRAELLSTVVLTGGELLSLYTSLPSDGLAIINRDDPALWPLPPGARYLSYGQHPGADIRLVRCAPLASGHGYTAEIEAEGVRQEGYFPHLITASQVKAVLPALALARRLTGETETALAALRQLAPASPDLVRRPGRYGSVLLDRSADAYAESMRHDLSALAAVRSGRRIAILGELARPEGGYQAVGRQAAASADSVVAVGEDISALRQAVAGAAGDVHHFRSVDDAGQWVAGWLKAADTVLVTGGAHMNMEKVVKKLLG